ncbi:hypothetical protein ABT218_18190 [Streptomyces sp. NPDC001455]|uniref:hypothetical protein n=1 Tax=unclassified Streptomyces TaxID=2593676 RepID=UPI003330E9AD
MAFPRVKVKAEAGQGIRASPVLSLLGGGLLGLAVGFVPASVVGGRRDRTRPLHRVDGLPVDHRPEREVLAVTRPRTPHPVADDLADLLAAAVAATRDA